MNPRADEFAPAADDIEYLCSLPRAIPEALPSEVAPAAQPIPLPSHADTAPIKKRPRDKKDDKKKTNAKKSKTSELSPDFYTYVLEITEKAVSEKKQIEQENFNLNKQLDEKDKLIGTLIEKNKQLQAQVNYYELKTQSLESKSSSSSAFSSPADSIPASFNPNPQIAGQSLQFNLFAPSVKAIHSTCQTAASQVSALLQTVHDLEAIKLYLTAQQTAPHILPSFSLLPPPAAKPFARS